MSRGYGTFARKSIEDESIVLYEYGDYNLNILACNNVARIYDGSFCIVKSGLVQPEIHETTRTLPSGRKQTIVKRIPNPIEYDSLLRSNLIKVENCSFCWEKSHDEFNVDLMVFRLLSKIFQIYQMEGFLPDEVACNY